MRKTYRGWLIEARPDGMGSTRIWHAFVDGSPITYTRYSVYQVTRSYGTAAAATGAGEENVNGEISAFAHQCRTDPHEAIKFSERRIEAVRKEIARAQKQLASALEWDIEGARRRLEDAERELGRRLTDLKDAQQALNQKA